jgi:hypothetical protein
VHVPVTPLERQRHGLVPAEAVEDVQVPLERQRLGDVPAVADARMANERPVSPGVGGQAGDGAVAAGIGAREGREGAVAASVGGRAGSEAGRGGAQGELLAALQGGRISVREAMDALLRGRT